MRMTNRVHGVVARRGRTPRFRKRREDVTRGLLHGLGFVAMTVVVLAVMLVIANPSSASPAR
jgi:hypothetical protein